ncbi:MAG: hypothetical protein ACRD7E_04960 [Bryobacteraceae bacterium]
MLIFGTLPKICYAAGMTTNLYARQVRIFHLPEVRCENAERLAANAGIEIGFIRKRNVRQEDLVKAALAKRVEDQTPHSKLDQFARSYCPDPPRFRAQYHWSVDQCEYPPMFKQ